MRWDLIDKFEVIKRGRFSLAKKAFTGREDFFKEHFPGRPIVPNPLFIEMIAQAGGVLFGVELGFKKEVVLAKIENARFFEPAVPPCEFRIQAALEEVREDGAWAKGVVYRGEEVVAEARVLLIAVDVLVEDKRGKIIFSDHFLKEYQIEEVLRMSEASL